MLAMQPPSPKTEKKMKETLYQDPETTARDVQHIKDWLSMQPHLPEAEDDLFLERFLYLCKYRLSRCKEVLDMYYTVRSAMTDLYGNRDPLGEDIQEIRKVVFVSTAPKLSPVGHRLTFLGLTDTDESRYSYLAAARRCLMIIDAHVRLEAWLGDVYVVDLKGATLTHLAKTPVLLVRRVLLCLQDALPIPIKGIHFVNAPFFMDKIMALMKPFLKEKIRNRIHVHSSMDSLYEILPRDMMPNEYGGQAGSVHDMNEWWQSQLNERREWFLSEQNRVADEKKRVGKTRNYEDLFGLDGSFKTLSID